MRSAFTNNSNKENVVENELKDKKDSDDDKKKKKKNKNDDNESFLLSPSYEFSSSLFIS